MIAGAIAKSEDLISEGRDMIVDGVFPFRKDTEKRRQDEKDEERKQVLDEWVNQGAVVVQKDTRFSRKAIKRAKMAQKRGRVTGEWKQL
jgi:hypothetical protein